MSRAKFFAALSTIPIVGYPVKLLEFREIGKLEKVEKQYTHTLKRLGVGSYRELRGRLQQYSAPSVPVVTRETARQALGSLDRMERERRMAISARLVTRVPQRGQPIGLLATTPREMGKRLKELRDLHTRLERVAQHHERVGKAGPLQLHERARREGPLFHPMRRVA